MIFQWKKTEKTVNPLPLRDFIRYDNTKLEVAHLKKILIINAGSSSLKWKLFSMPEEIVVAEGHVERINLADSTVKLKFNGDKTKRTFDKLSMNDAVQNVLNSLVESKIVSQLDEIGSVGHRLLPGGRI